MKKVVIIIVLGLIGGGVYLYKFNPEMLAQIQDQAKSLLAGSDWRDLKGYSKDFKKQNFENTGESKGFVSGLNDEMTKLSYKDADGATIMLAHSNKKPQALVLNFNESADKGVAEYAVKSWKHFFDQKADFSGNGSKDSKYAEGYWSVKNGNVTVEIFRKGIKKLPEVKDLSEEVQKAISSIKAIVGEKVKMEKAWATLDQERHFCFDSVRFKQITTKMKEIKDRSKELTEGYKKLKKEIPYAQLVLIQNELDVDSLQ